MERSGEPGVPRRGAHPARRRAGRDVGACLALLAALAWGCVSPPPPAAPVWTADFEAPRPTSTAGLLQAATQRARRGDLAGALRAAEQARARSPESGAAALREAELRAEVALRDGDRAAFEQARSDVESVQQAHPGEPAPRLALARLALLRGDCGTAAAEARSLATEREAWATPHVLLARCLLDESPAEALAEAERAVALAPADPDALGARARAQAALARETEAAEDARRALRQRPDPELEAVLARATQRLGAPRRAIARGERVLEAERPPALELALARSYLAIEDRAGARAAIERAGARAADAPAAQDDALELALELDEAEGRVADSSAGLEAARRARPDDARLAELSARADLALGRLAQAEASARRAVELGPTRPSAWATLGDVLRRAGARPPAEARAAAALGVAPDDARALLLACLVAEQAEQPDAAAALCERALARDPSLAVAQLHVAHALAARGREPERALALAESARQAVGLTLETASALGLALRSAGRPADAVTAFRIALAREPRGGNSLLLLVLAETLEEAGETGEALQIARSLVATGRHAQPEPEWLPRAKALRERLGPVPGAASPEP
jgi:tetratricopeptide (TPR) repeat protein